MSENKSFMFLCLCWLSCIVAACYLREPWVLLAALAVTYVVYDHYTYESEYEEEPSADENSSANKAPDAKN